MKRLFSNTVFSSIDVFTLVTLNLLATPVLIKYLGIAEYGVFIFLSIFSTYGLLNLFDFGMEGALQNHVARFEAAGEKRKIQSSLTMSLVFYGLIGTALGLALYMLAGFVESRFIDETGGLNRAVVRASISIVSVNVFMQFLSLPFTAVLQGLRRFVISKSVDTAFNVLKYVLLIATAIYFRRIDVAFMVILVVTTVRLLVLICIVRYRLPYFRPMQFGVEYSVFKSLFSYSAILFVSRIIGIVFNQMDKFLIWLYLVITQMAIYDIVVRPANLIRIMIGVINSAVIPEVARLHHQKEMGRLRTLYIDLVRYAYLIIVPVLAVGYVHMESLLSLWVGDEFGQYSYMALVMLSVYLLAPVASMASTMAVGLEIVKKVIWISIVASIINIVLSLFLLKFMGLVGLLVATLAAEMFMVFPYLAAMMRILDMRAWEILGPSIKIIAVGVPFVAANMAVYAVLGSDLLLWSVAVAVLMLSHFAVNYKFLLTSGEKLYLLGRLGIDKTRVVTGEVSH